MNEILRALHERKSVRLYEDRPVPDSVKAAVLEAAVQAPTAGNQQLYTILDITEPQLKHALSITCDNQPFIAQAPMVLVFLADCKKWYDAFRYADCSPREPGVGDLLLAVSDANIAAQNAVTAAESLGLGSCYIGNIMEHAAEQRRLLHLPDYVFPAAMVVFGYPTQQQRRRPALPSHGQPGFSGTKGGKDCRLRPQPLPHGAELPLAKRRPFQGTSGPQIYGAEILRLHQE